MGENEVVSQGQNQDAGRRPWNALDEWKLRLQGRVLDGAKKASTFKLAMIANQLRFQAFTNIENDPTGGKVEAKLGSHDMYAIFAIVEAAVADRAFKTAKVPCMKGPENEQVLESYVVIGRDSEQCVFIGLEPGPGSDCKSNMAFKLYPSSYHGLVRADGQEAGKAEISEYWASAWVSLMRVLCANVLSFNGKDRSGQENVNGEPLADRPKPQWQGKSGGNGGGFQKKPWQGNGGGFQKKPWQGGGGGNGGGFKKPWQGGGNGGGGYKKPWQGNQNSGGNSGSGYSGEITVNDSGDGFDDGMPF